MTPSVRRLTRDHFEALVLPLEDALFARAMGLERSPHDAWDLVQDTFERALRNFCQFQLGTNVRLWLFRVMYNLFVDRYRRRSHDLPVEPLGAEDVPAPEPAQPDEWERFGEAEVRTALVRLEAPFRRVLELHLTEQRTYRDISSELGIPAATVGTRLMRGRQKLRALLMATPELRA